MNTERNVNTMNIIYVFKYFYNELIPYFKCKVTNTIFKISFKLYCFEKKIDLFLISKL